MGLFDRFLPGGKPTYKPSPVPIEGAVGAWTGARTAGGLSVSGGQVVLTKSHLVFSPWDMDRTRAWLVEWLGRAGVPHVGDVDKLLTATKLLEPVVLPLAQISTVEELNRASLLKPPQARLHLTDGRSFAIGILSSPRSLSLNPANNAAFDSWLTALRAELASRPA